MKCKEQDIMKEILELSEEIIESIGKLFSRDPNQDDSNISSLHVIINGKEKFKNKVEGVDYTSPEAIQKQLLLSRQRLENFGK